MSDSNYTKCPNEVFKLLPHLSGTQTKIIFYLLRMTKGYQVESARISARAFMAACGLKSEAVINAIDDMVSAGLLVRFEVKNSFEYSIDFDGITEFLQLLDPDNQPAVEVVADAEQQTLFEADRFENQNVSPIETFRKSKRLASKIETVVFRNSKRNTPDQINKEKRKLLKKDNAADAANLSDDSAKGKGGRKKKEPVDDETRARRAALKAMWLQKSGAKRQNEAATNAAIEKLDNDKVTPQLLADVYDWLDSQEFWHRQVITPAKIYGQLDAYEKHLLEVKTKGTTNANSAASSNGGNRATSAANIPPEFANMFTRRRSTGKPAA